VFPGEESLDFGSPENIPSPLTIGARGSAVAQARLRTQLRPSNGRLKSEAVAIEDLESRPPISKGFRPPPLRFQGMGEPLATDGEGQPEPEPQAEERQPELEGADDGERPSSDRSSGLTLRPLLDEDVDQVWDWIRTEPDRAEPFFGEYFKSSLALHTKMRAMLQMESQSQALVRAIDWGEGYGLCGLAIAWPINWKDRLATLHLYLAPDVRHQAVDLLPELIAEGEALLPSTMRLAVLSNRPGWQQLLEPLGFIAHTVLIKERG
jgi:hypothetical protein